MKRKPHYLSLLLFCLSWMFSHGQQNYYYSFSGNKITIEKNTQSVYEVNLGSDDNLYLVYLPTHSDALSISNMIYESGLVEYSVPDFEQIMIEMPKSNN